MASYEYSPSIEVENTEPPRQWGGILRKTISTLAAAGTLGAAAFFGHEVVGHIQEVEALNAELNKPCKPIQEDEIQKMLDTMEKAQATPPPYTMFGDYGLTLLPTTDVRHAMSEMSDPHEIVRTANAFTTAHYGFETAGDS